MELNNFMLFDRLSLRWSPKINIISGENSTGKTTLIKAMYAALKGVSEGRLDRMTKEEIEGGLVKKLQGVFRPDDDKIGRLASRGSGGSRASLSLCIGAEDSVSVGFSSRQDRHADVSVNIGVSEDGMAPYFPVYIPPKEMISATEHFQSLYETYHIDFEEMYYDLTKLLDRPLKKGGNTEQQNSVIESFGRIINGSIVQRDKKFYLKMKGKGEFEMGLVSEGYRKLATIIYLISSGSLNENSILFWDEPETNMNPMMIKPIAEAVAKLAEMGVQVFITTHDYFVQQSFNLLSAYPPAGSAPADIKFISLYKEDGQLCFEEGRTVSELNHNSIMEEFDNLYDREQELIYGN
ncbi:ATP-binding protein [uncultured Cloacibacillus sp.]|uniref:AAA family ATPase n=1 Tax=uncultured Cloacibacillus sp. TaxID=889794 RepID=UPI00237C78B4|nr:ATP-binding protein [Cloacibacillus porcorum]